MINEASIAKAGGQHQQQQQEEHRPGPTGTGTGTGTGGSVATTVAPAGRSMSMMSPLGLQQQQQQQDGHHPNNILSTLFGRRTGRNNNDKQQQQQQNRDKESDTQALLAAELNRLSVKERDEVLLDIHGCSGNNMVDSSSSSRGKRNGDDDEEKDEDDDDAVSIGRFLEHLQTIPDEEKRAYLLAVEQEKNTSKDGSVCGKSEKSLSSATTTAAAAVEAAASQSYVHDPNFILMFLRCDRFNVADAAKRFVTFFEQKLMLFGPEKLARDIWWSDLSDDDQSALQSGYVQILSKRDRAGRAIVWFNPRIDFHKEEHRDSTVAENMMRAVYMVYMFALKDVQTQKNGFVACSYNLGHAQVEISELEVCLKLAKLASTLPVRWSAIHYGYDEDKMRMVMGMVLPILSKTTRLRCRVHYTSCQEFKYTLMSFGIPEHVMPVTSSGEYRLENHKDFVRTIRWADRERKAKTGNDQVRESTQVEAERIVLPNNIDVLLGRGRPLQKHYGNQNYHFLVEEYHAEYERSTKSKKTTMTKTILDRIKQYGGRFLKQDDVGYWVEIDDDTARSKISQTFRNHRCAAREGLKKKKRAVVGAEEAQAPVAAAAAAAPVDTVDMSPVLDKSLAGVDVEGYHHHHHQYHERHHDHRRELSHDVAPTSIVDWNTSSDPSWQSSIENTLSCTSGTAISDKTVIGTSYSHRHHNQQLQQQQADQRQYDPFHSVIDEMFSQQKRRRFDNNVDFDFDLSSSPSSTKKILG